MRALWVALGVAALAAPAWAGSSGAAVYINGVRAEALRDVQLKGVNVRVDAQGNVWIDAPQYAVEVDGRAAGASVAPVAVESGLYWLVIEDNGSVGHSVQVAINGALVRTVVSGAGVKVLDLGPFLKRGANTVLVQAAAVSGAGGGALNLHVGVGQMRGGALVVDRTVGSFFRRVDNAGTPDSRSFQLDIP
jgi:hypothetical protein